MRADDGTRDLLDPVNAVGVACQRVNPVVPIQSDCQRQQELNIAPAPSLAAHGDSGFTARQQNAGRGERQTVRRNAGGDGPQCAGDVAGFALDRVAKDVAGDAVRLRHCGGGLQRNQRRRN